MLLGCDIFLTFPGCENGMPLSGLKQSVEFFSAPGKFLSFWSKYSDLYTVHGKFVTCHILRITEKTMNHWDLLLFHVETSPRGAGQVSNVGGGMKAHMPEGQGWDISIFFVT